MTVYGPAAGFLRVLCIGLFTGACSMSAAEPTYVVPAVGRESPTAPENRSAVALAVALFGTAKVIAISVSPTAEGQLVLLAVDDTECTVEVRRFDFETWVIQRQCQDSASNMPQPAGLLRPGITGQ